VHVQIRLSLRPRIANGGRLSRPSGGGSSSRAQNLWLKPSTLKVAARQSLASGGHQRHRSPCDIPACTPVAGRTAPPKTTRQTTLVRQARG